MASGTPNSVGSLGPWDFQSACSCPVASAPGQDGASVTCRTVDSLKLGVPLLAGAGSRARGCNGRCECNASKPQAKLAVGAPGDRYEREADRIADAIVSRSGAPPSRVNVGVPTPQRKAWASDAVAGDAGVSDQAVYGLGGGRPLDGARRAYFESRLGHDPSRVRFHSGAAAAESATALGARAHTVGRHVVFGAGEYAPGLPAGQQLLAHELVHWCSRTLRCREFP